MLATSATALAATCVAIAMITDLRRRRVPNWLTFPAIVAGLGLLTTGLGWEGLASSAGGMLAAPLLLVLLHAGRGPGMGDLKLAAAVGSLLGLRLSMIAMLLSAIAGGVLALSYQLHRGGPGASALATLLAGVPGLARWVHRVPPPSDPSPQAGIPYAVGIAVGSWVAILVAWCTEGKCWHP